MAGFCRAFELQDLLANPALAKGSARTEARLRERLRPARRFSGVLLSAKKKG